MWETALVPLNTTSTYFQVGGGAGLRQKRRLGLFHSGGCGNPQRSWLSCVVCCLRFFGARWFLLSGAANSL